MGTPLVIPAAFAEWMAQMAGEAGRGWISRLPTMVESFRERWGLEVDGAPMHGGLSLVVPVRRGGELCVLKIAWPNESSAHEVAALLAWDGAGVVRLLEFDLESRVSLLERLDVGKSLADVEIGEAIQVAAGLIRRLSIPGPAEFPRLVDVASELAESVPARWRALGSPIDRRQVDAAAALAAELGPQAGSLLVNWDLHYENVLAGSREPWLVIDPKALVGDPEYGIGQLLWTRLEDMEASGGLGRHFDVLVEGAALDPRLARAWSLVRCVDYCLWALGAGLTEDPARCVRIADWLLG